MAGRETGTMTLHLTMTSNFHPPKVGRKDGKNIEVSTHVPNSLVIIDKTQS